jgi:hypothetical protein
VSDVASPPRSHSRRLLAAALVAYGLAVVVRAIVAVRTGSLYPDGVVDLELASLAGAGRWREVMDLRWHPGFGLLVALGAKTGAPLETTARVLAVALSALVAPLCALAAATLGARRRLNLQAAWAGGLLGALTPYPARLGGQVLSYGLAHACLAAALALGLVAARRRSPVWAAGAGLCVGLGHLARSDALASGAGLAVGLALAMGWAWRRRDVAGPRAAAVVGAFLLAAAVATTPYLVALRLHQGAWALSPKKSLVDLRPRPARVAAPRSAPTRTLAGLIQAECGQATSPAGAEVPSVLARGGEAVRIVLSATHPWLLALGLLGWIVARRPDRLELVLGACWLAFVSAQLLLKLGYWGYASRTHASGAAVIWAPLAGAGIVTLARAGLARGWPQRRLAAGLLATSLAMLLPKATQPVLEHKQQEAVVGRALRAGVGPGPLTVWGRDARVVAHYAEASYRDLPAGTPREAVRLIRAEGGVLVVYLRWRGERPQELDRELDALGLTLQASHQAERDDVRYAWLVYQP